MSDDDFDFENVPAETPLSPEDAVVRRHRREKKDLQGKILALKKSVTKSDKKKKKEVADEILRLESELEQRHKLELDAFKLKAVNVEPTPIAIAAETSKAPLKAPIAPLEDDDKTPMNSAPGTPKLSRAQKRRYKKSEQEKERQKRIEVETDILVENSEWKKEDRELEALLKNLQLEVFDIPADGHCLYSAVSHQLQQTGGKELGIEILRQRTGDYLLKNKAEFIHYFDESVSGSDEKFLNYCNEIQTTAAWGGQVEVQVLSRILERPIRVIQAVGPPLVFGEQYRTPTLTLTYHRHKIQSGEHYNSAIPKQKEK